ncbi:hypothetical protein EVAR_86871_1 [Eumeta japonica]|uniref:Nucleic-acid-binding protein from transposon X-element n=1 Tax=Eumeta variegata TaxID=151549 RepID=A0A4C1ZK42_EUMVA|nr:hypothetical protein EVAR_86871_1 [Eumeta japonica]
MRNIEDSSVRSPAPNGRYRAPAPSALTKLFAFCADRRPRPSRPADRRAPGAGLSPSGNGKPGRTWDHRPGGAPRRYQVSPAHPPSSLTPSSVPRLLAEHPIVCSHTCPSSSENSAGRPASSIVRPTNNRRLIRHLRNNRQLYDQTRTVSLNLPWTKIPLLPGAGGLAQNSITLEFIQQVLTKALSEIGYEAPQDASSSSDEGATCSDSTVVGSDSESENSNTSFTLVETHHRRPHPDDAKPSPLRSNRLRLRVPPRLSQPEIQSPLPQAVTAKTAPRTGAKPTAPPRPKLPPPIFCAKALTSSNIRRLHPSADKLIKPSAPPTTALKFTAQTLRLSAVSINIVDFKVNFTYALEERKLKAVIRGIPTDFPVDEIQADLCGQGFPVHSVHRLCHRDGSPLWLVLAVLPRTEEAKNIFNNLNMLYGHAAANCHADPRCVKCLVPHWTRECPRTRESGEKPSCVNCLQQHTANYGDVRKPLNLFLIIGLIPIGLKVGP